MARAFLAFSRWQVMNSFKIKQKANKALGDGI